MSNNIGRTEVTAGQNQKEVTINDSDGRIDAAVTEILISDYTAGNIVLTASQFEQAVLFRSSNLTVARSLTVVAVKKFFIVDNTAGTATLTVTLGSTTIGVSATEVSNFYTDGTTNGLTSVADAGVTTFLGLTDTPADYISDKFRTLRVNNEETVLEFVDPLIETGDSLFSNVQVLLGFEGADASTIFIDDSSAARTFTAVGDAQLSTAVKKFGLSSGVFDGAGDAITAPDAASLEIGSSNFAKEGFFRWTSDPDAFQFLMGKWLTAGSQKSYAVFLNGTGNTLELFLSTDGSASIVKIAGAFVPTLNQQYHIAADFDGTTYRLYVDGVSLGTATTPLTLFDGTATFSVGAQADGADPFDGHADEVRLTIGANRYPVAFTPPTTAFPRSVGSAAIVVDGDTEAVTVGGNLHKDSSILIASGQSEAWLLDFYNNTTDSAIGGLTGGSTFGGIVRGPNLGHFVIGLREDSVTDSFSIVSGGGDFSSDTTFDKLVARFNADGTALICGDLRIDGTYETSGAGRTVRLQPDHPSFGASVGTTTAFGFSIFTNNIFAMAISGTDQSVLFPGTITTDSFYSRGSPDELTIATAAVTLVKSFHTIDTEADAASDTLSTLTGGSEGDRLTLMQADSARDVTIDNAGNIRLVGGTFTFATVDDTIEFIKRASTWVETSRSINT